MSPLKIFFHSRVASFASSFSSFFGVAKETKLTLFFLSLLSLDRHPHPLSWRPAALRGSSWKTEEQEELME